MPLVLTENEATESGISYADKTGVQYEYPPRYRKALIPGERFVYYKGRLSRDGDRIPQVYFGAGIVGPSGPSAENSERLTCSVHDYRQFAIEVPFRLANGDYLERLGHRPGYFQPGVRRISEEEYDRILNIAAKLGDNTRQAVFANPSPPLYEFAVNAALSHIQLHRPELKAQRAPIGNPGFDVLLEGRDGARQYVRVKGTASRAPRITMSAGDITFGALHSTNYSLIIVYAIKVESQTFLLAWNDGPVTGSSAYDIEPIQWRVEAKRKGD